MTDSFVPLMTAPPAAGEAGMFRLRVLPQAEAKAVFEPLANGHTAPPAKPCAPPAVTLQRQGDLVSSIRIECGCGQVIELACGY